MLLNLLNKKKGKNSKDIYGDFGEEWIDYKEYLIKSADEKVFFENLELYRNKFHMAHEKGRMINTLDFVTYASLFSELFNYFNNDICIDVAKFLTMKESAENYNFRVIMSLVDSISTKICSCWEYMFQILNHYFSLELNSMALNKEKIDDLYAKKMVFVKEGDITHIEYVDWTEEEKEMVAKAVLKKKKVLNIGIKAKGLKKEIRKQGYVVSERFQQISILYAQECVENMKQNVRNIVMHKKSASFTYAIGEIDDLLPTEGISINRRGWITGNDFQRMIIENMAVLKEALQIAYDIVCLGDKLVHIGNENKTYEIVLLECVDCKKIINMTDSLYEIMLEMNGQVNCPECKNRMDFQSKGKTSEFEYSQVLYREMEMFFGKETQDEE